MIGLTRCSVHARLGDDGNNQCLFQGMKHLTCPCLKFHSTLSSTGSQARRPRSPSWVPNKLFGDDASLNRPPPGPIFLNCKGEGVGRISAPQTLTCKWSYNPNAAMISKV